MDGLGSYSNGIFGGGALGADDGTAPPALPAAGGDAKTYPFPDAYLGAKKYPGALPTEVDQAFFFQGGDSAQHLRPELMQALAGRLYSLSVGGLSAANYPPGVAFPVSASVIVPSDQVAFNPYFRPLSEFINFARAGNYDVVLPKEIVVPAPHDSTWLAFLGPKADIGRLAAAGPGNLFILDPVPTPPVVAPPPAKKAGMTLSTTLLIGAGVLAAGYVGTRLYQKKPIFPKK